MKDFTKIIHQLYTTLPGSTPKSTLYRLPVKLKYEGLSIIEFFLANVPRSTQDHWEEKIKAQKLYINNVPATLNSTVKGGDITSHESIPQIEPYISIDIQQIFEDDQILVIDKPAPLPMHPCGRFYRNTLSEILKQAFPDKNYKIIHRIDANTTGVVVLGKNNLISREICRQFELKTTRKTYLALIKGIPSFDTKRIETKIGTDKKEGGSRATNKNDGMTAITEIKIIQKFPKENVTLLAVKPITGRTNQIRLHLANIGHPIVGDLGYEDKNYFLKNPMTYNTDQLFLHAWKLTITYQNKTTQFTAKPPKKFEKYLQK